MFRTGNNIPLRLDNEMIMKAPTYEGITNGRVQRIKKDFLNGILERVSIQESGIVISKQVIVTVMISSSDFNRMIAVLLLVNMSIKFPGFLKPLIKR